LDNVFATRDEVRYLMEAIAQVLPQIYNARIVGTWAGVRPTLYAWGKPEDALSREHEVVDHTADGAAGLFSMIGGKLASYRLFAEELTDRVALRARCSVPCSTHQKPLPGGERLPTPKEVAEAAGIDALSASRLVYRHGAIALKLVEQLQQHPEEKEMVCACEPVLRAEVRHVVEQEWAFDVGAVSRRTRLGLGSCGGLQCVERCGALVAQYSGQSPAQGRRFAAEFRERQSQHRLSAVGGEQLAQELLIAEDAAAQEGTAEALESRLLVVNASGRPA
jgi:glycerol-3-phosphate dehydrogenase